MDAIRRKLYGAAWMVFITLLAGVAAMRHRLPARLPSHFDAEGHATSWTSRDGFLMSHFLILALVLGFSQVIDRVLLRKYGDNAFLGAIALFMACVFTVVLVPPLAYALGYPLSMTGWLALFGLPLLGFFGAYKARMAALRGEDAGYSSRSTYFRRLHPSGLMAFLPFVSPFLPYSICLDAEGLLLRGALIHARWGWERIESVRAGKAAQVYGGSAIRLGVSGKDVIVVVLKDLRWPLVTNAPDREIFFETVRSLSPSVGLNGK